MKGRQLGRREPCHCGSGKRYKNCHGKNGAEIPPLVLTGDDGGFQGTVRVENVRASHFEGVDSQVPEWLFRHAAHYAEKAAVEGGHSATMMTLLLTAAASEALANRLLGPLEDPKRWPDLEWKLKPLEKWKALAAKLGLSEELSLGRAPLQQLADVQQLRNELSHFKHQRHSSSVTRSVPTTISNGRIVLDMANAGPPSETHGDGPDLEAALEASKARVYFGALLDTLELVLGRYREDAFHIVDRLKAVIQQARSVLG
jgi:hypothetical protein